MIPFNKPHLTGNENRYMAEAVATGKISGNGLFTGKCHTFFEQRFGFGKCLLTTSCTDALEMSALLCNLQQGDEVILPSYTFVSTANAFVLRGARLLFADSQPSHPNIDLTQVEALITPRTRALVVVHYAGMACDMARAVDICRRHNLYLIEDAAQAIDSYYLWPGGKRQPLGTLSDAAAFSFHETKNIISGEGGMLALNRTDWNQRAEILWEKGTNRAAFFRGDVDKYGWVDVGSSFLPSDLTAAFLYAQLEHLDEIQTKRKALVSQYRSALESVCRQAGVALPEVPAYATDNAHMFYLVCSSLQQRTVLINHLRKKNILSVFHYLSLHTSQFYHEKHDGRTLPNSDRFTDCLVRLPLYADLTNTDQDRVIEAVMEVLTHNH